MEGGRRRGIYRGSQGKFLFGNGSDDESQVVSGNTLDDRGDGGFNWNGNNYGGRDYDGCDCADSSSTSVTDQNLLPVSRSSSPPAAASSSSGCYIEHPVSKFDTLAGVAIRYGVEVADIRRLNGLVTDNQMFALMSILIPLSGRHLPSCSSDGFHNLSQSSYERTPPPHMQANLFHSFRSLRLKSSQQKEKASLAMSSMQGYHGLSSKDQVAQPDATEMAASGKVSLETYLGTNPSLNRHRKCRSVIMGFINEKGDAADQSTVAESSSGRWVEKPIGRHKRSESNSTATIPEMVLKGDTRTTIGTSGVSSAMAAKGLALRSKTTMSQMALGDLAQTTTSSSSLTSVRRSSSTSSLQDQEAGSLSSIWPSSLSKPIFDGLPKPQASRRNKKALD
ncbi:hypothetical protein SAY87_025897 [Trapa incisa]|uniref:LysM domain-containing protein n=1 Tax=Trapa incisa TaxID=236973 RepID=A0AAN7JKB5_9MYRT|nr:hypothetical protein SAY87_025897 [Trapa incisa]